MSTRSLADRVVIVTGASLGVGLACAQAFSAQGCSVVLVARRQGPLDEAIASLAHPERALTITADLMLSESPGLIVSKTMAHFGRVDGLINNAGAHFRGSVMSQPAETLASMVDVNLRAPIHLTRLVLDELQRHGGFVVHVASLAGRLPLDGASTYSATKFGLRAFSLALNEELRGTGVNSCIVSPGPVDTGFIMDDIDQVDDIVFSQKMCTAEAVANMVVDCARDGTAERAWPPGGAKLATFAYLVPSFRRWLKPMMRRKGKRAKDAIKARQNPS
ncbi:MAG: short-subunit dehydrogenase [Myxococcota bacterium]|jgi:short-subunit dehydrogenase